MTMRALIVDDSRTTRTILGRWIKALDFEVVEAEHGGRALERLAESGPFDVALVDWNMPEMNGLEFVKAVRAMPEFEALPLIMVTSEIETSQMARALWAGANEYIMKPLTADILRDKLQLLGILQG